MDVRKKLLELEKKTILLDDLVGLLKADKNDNRGLFEAVSVLVKDAVIEPVKNSGLNGNLRYPLYKKYRIILHDDSNYEVLKMIGKLHPSLLKSGYLSSHPKDYRDNKEVIDKLNKYLFLGIHGEQVSRKERSFEMFGHEKVLDDSNIKSLLKSLHLNEKDLGFYDTPEYCFHDYIPERKDNMTLLICENKDIWFNIRRCMFEDHFRSLFDVPIDGVVYGNGNKVSHKQGALVEYVRFMGNPSVKFLYWGDIDREGFDIFRRTREVNSALDVQLFIPGYRRMIERARNIEIEDSPSSKKDGMNFEDLIGDFSEEEQEFLHGIFLKNKLIPQEIIPYTLLSER